jgi:NADH:ubiquinone oxidoreductase subunit E
MGNSEQKITVSICAGTACYVTGASEIMLLEDHLPDEVRDRVQVEGVTCTGKCKNPDCGRAPFVLINGEVLAGATLYAVLEKVLELTGR